MTSLKFVRRGGSVTGMLLLIAAVLPMHAQAAAIGLPTVSPGKHGVPLLPPLVTPSLPKNVPLLPRLPVKPPVKQQVLPRAKTLPAPPAPPPLPVKPSHAPPLAPVRPAVPRTPHLGGPRPQQPGVTPGAAPSSGDAASPTAPASAGPAVERLARHSKGVNGAPTGGRLAAHAAAAAAGNRGPLVTLPPALQPARKAPGGGQAGAPTAGTFDPRRSASSAAPASPSSSGGELLGMRIPPAARDAILGSLLAVLAGTLVVALMFADGLGLGPRHQEWARRLRGRWARRQSW